MANKEIPAAKWTASRSAALCGGRSWIQASAGALPAELRRGRFDLVYSPEGVLAGVNDLEAWARGIDDALHEHGELLVYDDHPVALCVDAFARWQYDYFGEGLWRLGTIVTMLVRGSSLGASLRVAMPGGVPPRTPGCRGARCRAARPLAARR